MFVSIVYNKYIEMFHRFGCHAFVTVCVCVFFALLMREDGVSGICFDEVITLWSGGYFAFFLDSWVCVQFAVSAFFAFAFFVFAAFVFAL